MKHSTCIYSSKDSWEMFGSLAFSVPHLQAVWLKNRDLFSQKLLKEEKGLVGPRAGGYSL